MYLPSRTANAAINNIVSVLNINDLHNWPHTRRRGIRPTFGCVSVSVCLSVCLTINNFRKLWHRKFIFAHSVYLKGIRVKFVYEGHRVKVKVTGAKKRWKSLFPQYKTLIANNFGSSKDRAMKFACSMGFLAMTDRMVWPPSLSRDRKWLRATKCTHSQIVVGLILEGNLV